MLQVAMYRRLKPYLISAWLLDLAAEVPSNWALQCYDISALQSPTSQYLPNNVSLGILDAFDDVP